MSLQPESVPAIPEETARIARAIFPKGNRYLLLRDELGTIYTDELFLALYPQGGSYVEAPWRLAPGRALCNIWKTIQTDKLLKLYE